MQTIDFTDHIKIWAISEELLKQSKAYAQARTEYAYAKFEFDMALARELPSLREKKPNIGVETAQMMVLEGQNHRIKDNYRIMIEKENHFKGLEKIVDALKSQVTLCQSLIKNQNQNT
jgi:hypothetical protein